MIKWLCLLLAISANANEVHKKKFDVMLLSHPVEISMASDLKKYISVVPNGQVSLAFLVGTASEIQYALLWDKPLMVSWQQHTQAMIIRAQDHWIATIYPEAGHVLPSPLLWKAKRLLKASPEEILKVFDYELPKK